VKRRLTEGRAPGDPKTSLGKWFRKYSALPFNLCKRSAAVWRDFFRQATKGGLGHDNAKKAVQTNNAADRAATSVLDHPRAAASRLPAGEERDQLLKKAQVSDRAVEMEGYLTSRELVPPS
jgi:hypothetical protein